MGIFKFFTENSYARYRIQSTHSENAFSSF